MRACGACSKPWLPETGAGCSRRASTSRCTSRYGVTAEPGRALRSSGNEEEESPSIRMIKTREVSTL
ncbi:hypothetical protein P4114_15520 [Pseudomonas aeruginosa]|nr:hypothetical protein [Pseudomonas aeruginosa]